MATDVSKDERNMSPGNKADIWV